MMMMIPRYQPSIDLWDWIRWLYAPRLKPGATQTKPAYAGFKETWAGRFGEGSGEFIRQTYAFANARQALYAYFEHLKQAVGSGTILISAQICPVVPYLVKELGFTVRFVDADGSYPTPGASQYLEAIESDTVGMIVSPLYGYVQEEWQSLVEKLEKIQLILDLAQGLGLESRIHSLFQRADAVVYSFGIGKGLDAGGGILLISNNLDIKKYRQSSELPYFSIFLKGMVLHFLIKSGFYYYFIKQLDEAVENMKEPRAIATPCLAPSDIYLLWNAKLNCFWKDVALARDRARELAELPLVQKACRDIPIFCHSQAIHLRQILRFKDSTLRDQVLNTLQKSGVDCLSGGEPLPNEYFSITAPADFPNARIFREDSIRLPFLGRLSELQFNQLKRKLEDAIAQHLSEGI